MGGNSLQPARRGERRDPTDVPARRIGGNAPKSPQPPSHEAHEARVALAPCCVREFLSVALFFRRPAKRKTPGKSPGKSSAANQLTRVSGLPSRSSDAIHRRSRPEAICPESLMASSSPSPVRQGPALLPRQPQSPHPGRPSRSEPLAGPDTSGVPIVPTRTGPSSAATKSRGLWGDPRHGSPHPRPRCTRRGPGKNFRLRKATARRWVPGMLRPANPEHHPFHYSSLVYPRYVSIRLTQYSTVARIRPTRNAACPRWKTLPGPNTHGIMRADFSPTWKRCGFVATTRSARCYEREGSVTRKDGTPHPLVRTRPIRFPNRHNNRIVTGSLPDGE